MSRLTVAGIGPGEADYILPAVIKKMKKAHTVIAAKRILPVLKELCQDVNSEADSENNKPVFLAMGKIKDTLEQIGEILSKGQDVVMAVSGDPLMYSLYRTICNDPISESWEVDLIPGVGSSSIWRNDGRGIDHQCTWKSKNSRFYCPCGSGESQSIFPLQ